MGVMNVTPDSFSDGGRHLDPAAAIEHGQRLVEQGADLLDIGGESTRPGAQPLPLEEELCRVLPVVEALSDLGVPVSIDTYKPATMRAALAAGASMINDVNALQAPGALDVVRNSDCGVCLMHMQGNPQTMQVAPEYRDVVAEVREFLARRVAACEAAGIARDRLVVDPGFGFGKKTAHNLELLRHLDVIAALGLPVLVGLSRKSTLGKITGKPVTQRVSESIAAALLAVQRGASIVRVHDVDETRDALLVLAAIVDDAARFDA
ncbi:MAG TPA: dihydropteroate synthase [Burkholderiales bacterium]|nr:dihydropteroate synthase [Burkholderiales bacterium]